MRLLALHGSLPADTFNTLVLSTDAFNQLMLAIAGVETNKAVPVEDDENAEDEAPADENAAEMVENALVATAKAPSSSALVSKRGKRPLKNVRLAAFFCLFVFFLSVFCLLSYKEK